MSRAAKASLKDLRAWVFKSVSRVQKIANGQGVAGTRAAPSQSGNNDAKIGSRLDHGENVTKDGKQFKRFKFQINNGAEDKTLKELANQDSHKVWAQADLPLDGGSADQIVSQLFDDLEEDLKK